MENNFVVYRKVSIWERTTFSIEADSKKEALNKLVEDIVNETGEFEETSCDFLYGEMAQMTAAQNDGISTIEIMDEDGNLLQNVII